VHYRWDRTKALNLDDDDPLTEEIDERIREAGRTGGAESACEEVIAHTAGRDPLL
jgi:hypothetical protein